MSNNASNSQQEPRKVQIEVTTETDSVEVPPEFSSPSEKVEVDPEFAAPKKDEPTERERESSSTSTSSSQFTSKNPGSGSAPSSSPNSGSTPVVPSEFVNPSTPESQAESGATSESKDPSSKDGSKKDATSDSSQNKDAETSGAPAPAEAGAAQPAAAQPGANQGAGTPGTQSANAAGTGPATASAGAAGLTGHDRGADKKSPHTGGPLSDAEFAKHQKNMAQSKSTFNPFEDTKLRAGSEAAKGAGIAAGASSAIPSAASSSTGSKALDTANAAKDIVAKDENKGAAGKEAKRAGIIKGAQGALDGFNEGGFKQAAVKGAAEARKGAAAANAQAASMQAAAGSEETPGEKSTKPASSRPSAPQPAQKSESNVKVATKLAASGIKAAIIAALVALTGVPPEVWSKILSKKMIFLILALVLIPPLAVLILIFGALGGAGDVPNPDAESREQSIRYMSPGWQETVLSASNGTAREDISIPWPVLAGIAKSATDFGRNSPFLEEPKDLDPLRHFEGVLESSNPAEPNAPMIETPLSQEEISTMQKTYPGLYGTQTSNCQARTPMEDIGGKGMQGVGPYLLTPDAANDMDNEGKDPQDPCDSSNWVAKKLSQQAKVTLRENPDLTDPSKNPEDGTEEEKQTKRKQNQDFWAKVISDSGIIQGPTGSASLSECTVPASTDGTELPVGYLIEQIWNCEITLGDPVHLVSSISFTGDIAIYNEYPAGGASQALIQEAKSVSYAFSAWDPATCDPNAKVAGIFPLDTATAATYGVSDRCDVQQSIRGAARAVLAIERTPGVERSTAQGAFEPMIGGWMNIPGVIGPDKARLLREGPATRWVTSAVCNSSISGYINAIAPEVPGIASVWDEDNGATTWSSIWGPVIGAAENKTGVSYASVQASCPGVPERELLTRIADYAFGKGNQMAATVNAGNPYDPNYVVPPFEPLLGLGAYFEARRDASFVQIEAKYGETSLISPRLSDGAMPVSVPSVDGYRLAQPLSTFTGVAMDYAVFYGGVSEPFDTVGLRTGSLIVAVPGGLSELGENEIPADLIPLFLEHGQRCALISPALLAAQAKAESGFNPKAVSSAGAMGLTQFMGPTWASVGIDGDGDGIKDPYNPADSIASQAKYMCELAELYADGRFSENASQLDLTLASYNAGQGSVSRAQGIPPFKETQNYVVKINKLLAIYSAVPMGSPGNVDASGCPAAVPAGTLRRGAEKMGSSALCAASIAQARSPEAAQAIIYMFNNLGVTYSQANRNQIGFFDCSSFVSRAYQSAGVNIAPPGVNAPSTRSMRVSAWAIPIGDADIRPGDLVQPTSGHVVAALADGYIIHSPQPGDVTHVTKKYHSQQYWGAWVDPSKVR